MVAKSRKWKTAGVLAILLLAGCGAQGQNGEGSSQADRAMKEEAEMAASIETKETDEHTVVHFQVENTSGKEMSLTFPNGLQADYVLFDEEGKELGRLSENMFSTQAVTETAIPSGETLEYEFVIDGLPNGSYSIEAFLTAKESDEKAIAEFEITKSPFVKDSGELAVSSPGSVEIKTEKYQHAFQLSEQAASQLPGMKEGSKVDFVYREDGSGNRVIERFM